MANTKDPFITIFTPTYNRVSKLLRLYSSLCKQTYKNFIWLVVDDGSADGTKKLIKHWKRENKITIQYVYQINQGKAQAHNLAVAKTFTKFFSCVDSDDYLTNNAVEVVYETSKKLKIHHTGILAFRKTNEDSITVLNNTKILESTLTDAYNKYGLKGDTFLIFRTKILKRYRFPYFEGENFITERYIYDQIDKEGKLYILRKALYIGEYLKDGYTNNSNKLVVDNPKGLLAYTEQSLKLDRSTKNQIIKSIQHITYSKIAFNRYNFNYSTKTKIFFILGYLLFKLKYEKLLDN